MPEHLANIFGKDHWALPISLPAVFAASRGRQKGVHLAGACRANACDLPAIIDRIGEEQIQRRVRRDEFVEAGEDFVLPEERVRAHFIEPKANHVASVVNGVTAGRHGREGPGKLAEVLNTCVPGPHEGVNGTISMVRIPGHHTQVIDGGGNMIPRASRRPRRNTRSCCSSALSLRVSPSVADTRRPEAHQQKTTGQTVSDVPCRRAD
jgi:hypothetical protein